MKGDFFMKNCKQNDCSYNTENGQQPKENIKESTKPANIPVLDFGSNDLDTVLFDVMERVCS